MPHEHITPDLLLRAYASGIFPMAEDRTDAGLFWLDPDERGIIPLNGFKLSRSLSKKIKRQTYRVTINKAFRSVVQECAKPADGRESTWISERIESLYHDLHTRGFAHSVECWDDSNPDEDPKLVGGLYGVCFNGAYFGESMFHRATDASKIALAYLVARLKHGGFILLDTQFVTDHLISLGATEIPRVEYHARLRDAMDLAGDFYRLDEAASPSDILQLITQTS